MSLPNPFKKSDKEAGQRDDSTKKDVDYGDDLAQREVVHDHDVLEDKDVTREDAMHMGELTPEELANEKKLRKRIDTMIMPLVMLVSCAPRTLPQRNRQY